MIKVPQYDCAEDMFAAAKVVVLRTAASRQDSNAKQWEVVFAGGIERIAEYNEAKNAGETEGNENERFEAFYSPQFALNVMNNASSIIDFLLSLPPTLDLITVVIYIVWLSNNAEDGHATFSFTNPPKERPDKPPNWTFVASTLACRCKANVEITALNRKLTESAVKISVLEDQLVISEKVISDLREQALSDQARINALTENITLVGVKATDLQEQLARQVQKEAENRRVKREAIRTCELTAMAADFTAKMAEANVLSALVAQNQADAQHKLAEIAELRCELAEQHARHQTESAEIELTRADFRTALQNLTKRANAKAAEVTTAKRIIADLRVQNLALQKQQRGTETLSAEFTQLEARRQQLRHEDEQHALALDARRQQLRHEDEQHALALDARRQQLGHEDEQHEVDILRRRENIASDNPRGVLANISHWWTNKGKDTQKAGVHFSVGPFSFGIGTDTKYAVAPTSVVV